MRTWIVCLSVLAGSVSLTAAEKESEKPDVLKHKMASLKGQDVDLSQYQGKVLLIVNTASQCGYTPQYEGLQALHKKYADQGLAVLGFPCNQFGAQEPGSAEQIGQFCKKNYGVTFDLFEKIDVNGDKQAPLFKYLQANSDPTGPIKWNFEKFLVSKDGEVIGRYRSSVKPQELARAIQAELTK